MKKKDRQEKFKAVTKNISLFFKMTPSEVEAEVKRRLPALANGTPTEYLQWLILDEIEKLEERY